MYDNYQMSMEEKYITYGSLVYSIEYTLGCLKYTEELVKCIEEKRYLNMEGYLLDKINLGEYEENGELIVIPVASMQKEVTM